jgi:hypothetical protein
MQHFLVTDMAGRIFAFWGTSFDGGTDGITIDGIIKGQGQLPRKDQQS